MTTMLRHGDMRDVLATLDAESVHACVTDPPYELGFMGKGWDKTGIAFDPAAWAEVYRVLKPGAFLLAFSATRTYHRMACAIEDAGFEIREQIMWLYGSGMPKGLNVSKAIDKQAGAEREVISRRVAKVGFDPNGQGGGGWSAGEVTETTPATDAARQWDGWNSAIKPACEPICVARKPFPGTLVNNVLTHGTGAFHVDACRIGTETKTNASKPRHDRNVLPTGWTTGTESQTHNYGRWPANVILDADAAAVLDAMSGESKSTGGQASKPSGFGEFGGGTRITEKRDPGFGDTGGASRFFFIARHDCWLCGNPKRGTMNATNHAEGEECLEPASTAETSLSPSTSPADSVAGVVPDLQPLRLGDSNPEASTFVRNAASTSMSGRETSESTAQRNAIQHHAAQLAPRVKSAGDLCDSCAIGTAQKLAQMLHAPSETSRLGADSIGDSPSSILTRNLALYAEPWVNTGTIPTTASLGILFGSVRHAIGKSTARHGPAPNRFLYTSKSSQAERNIGHAPGERNQHATVKPIDLMQWLVRLVTPPDGIVLDPFMGSGSTGVACSREGFQFIGIDLDETNVQTARKRIVGDAPLFASVAD